MIETGVCDYYMVVGWANMHIRIFEDWSNWEWHMFDEDFVPNPYVAAAVTNAQQNDPN